MTPHTIFAIDENGKNTDPVACVTPADPKDALEILSKPATGHNNRSQWVWLRLPDGTLILGVFPQGDTYMHYSDGGVCDWDETAPPTDRVAELLRAVNRQVEKRREFAAMLRKCRDWVDPGLGAEIDALLATTHVY